MLVEFTRAQTTVIEGEDDAVQTVEHPVSVNPVHVAAVLEDIRSHSPVVVIRLADGRGLKVRGSYSEVIERLRAAGGDVANVLETMAI
jgi:uncharacterized protein YlzI (FlbEa/FlbD family)